ncbi:MAG: histidinol-phosphate transaminase [Terrisporobacter sp.]
MSVNHGANLYDLSNKYGFTKDDFLDFSSNINPFGTSTLAKEYVINNINMVSVYPDPDYINLKESISSYCKCNVNNMILGSGATELISSFIATINPKKAVLISPAYSEYERELEKNNCEIIKYFSKASNNFQIDPVDLIDCINEDEFDLIIICNPNNPTGFTFSKYEIEVILKNTNAFVMVDETYIEFTNTDIYSSSSLVDTYDNLFVIRGTSKFFSTPGIRLGYGLIGNNDIKNNISKNLDLWNINIIASTMGEIMFKDREYISHCVDVILKERDYLTQSLTFFEDLKVFESKGNFILCKIKSKKITANELRSRLIPKKIIIRDCESFDGLDEYYFRVCVLKPDDNRYLIDNLRQVFI